MGIKKSQLALVNSTPSVALDAQLAPPSTEAGKAKLYSKAVEGITEFFVLDTDGNEIQVTSNGAVAGGGGGGGGGLVFGDVISTPGFHTAVVGEIALVVTEGVTLTLPSSPVNNARLAVGGFYPVTMYSPSAGTTVINPVSQAGCATNTAAVDFASGHFVEYVYNETFNAWVPTFKSYYSSLLELKNSGSAVTCGTVGIKTLDVTGYASLSYCSGSGVATLDVPAQGGGGGGGFPPIARYLTSGTVTATLNCSYVFNCAGCSAHCVLYLPEGAVEGDQVGGLNRNNGGMGFEVQACGGVPKWSPGYSNTCSSNHYISPNTPVVWRFNGTEWDYVQA